MKKNLANLLDIGSDKPKTHLRIKGGVFLQGSIYIDVITGVN